MTTQPPAIVTPTKMTTTSTTPATAMQTGTKKAEEVSWMNNIHTSKHYPYKFEQSKYCANIVHTIKACIHTTIQIIKQILK